MGRWVMVCEPAYQNNSEPGELINPDDCSFATFVRAESVYPSAFLPPLTGEEGALIGAAIVGAWCVGFAVRAIRKAL